MIADDGLRRSAPGLDLRAERVGSTMRITVTGELDVHNSRQLERLGVEALDDDTVDRLLLDCRGVTHVGSSGLSMLIELDRAAWDRAAVLRVERPSRVVRRLLELAGLTRIIVEPPRAPTDDRGWAVA